MNMVFCQKDNFVMSKNIYKLKALKFLNIISIIQSSSQGSLGNKKESSLREFKVFQFIKLGLMLFFNNLLDLVDYISPRKLKFLRRAKAASKANESDFIKIKNFNSKKNKKYLNENNYYFFYIYPFKPSKYSPPDLPSSISFAKKKWFSRELAKAKDKLKRPIELLDSSTFKFIDFESLKKILYNLNLFKDDR